MIVISGTVRIRPDARAAAIAAATEMAVATRREPGCGAYRFGFDVEDANVVHLFEEWESDEALARHFQTEHMRVFRTKMPGIVAAPPEFHRYTVAAKGRL